MSCLTSGDCFAIMYADFFITVFISIFAGAAIHRFLIQPHFKDEEIKNG